MNNFPGRWFHREPDSDRIVCDLCPRQCRMKEGDRGFCFVRRVQDDAMVLDTYGRSTGFCIDPIEKKPLNHFYPGTSVLSFGTAGCNLGCQFCQNWDISKSREVAKLSSQAGPESIATAALELGCRSVAFTYNDPVVWAEYAIDTAVACHDLGVRTVAVTAGYILPEARRELFAHMDAANVDLKAFSESFYKKITYSHLEPVLETLRYLKHETDVWFEITNLIIPGENDSPEELKRMCDWILEHLGPDVPIHFSAFHPDFRMLDRPNTPPSTLLAAHTIARASGLNFAYVGNVHDLKHGSTYCWNCNGLCIGRDWYELTEYHLIGNVCKACGAIQPGVFDAQPGRWGRRRQPVDMRRYQGIGSDPNAQPVPKLVRLSPPSAHPTTNGVSLTVSTDTHVETSPGSRSQGTRKKAMSHPMLPEPKLLAFLDLTSLEPNQRALIQQAAQRVVAATVLRTGVAASVFEPLGELANQLVHGCFTTLRRGTQLRGCCGVLGKPTTLRDAILDSAHRTARQDNRMPSISSIELPYLSCHVTLLAPQVPVAGKGQDRKNGIVVGKHGLWISSSNDSAYGPHSGLLLPSVPVEQGWDVPAFLAGVCRKAGLPEDVWLDPNVRLETFEGLAIEGSMDQADLPDTLPIAPAPGNLEGLFRLKQAAAQSLIALAQGRTPNYYVLDAMDGNVHGLIVTAVDTDGNQPVGHWIQTSLRPGLPLQATLFDLCKLVETTLRRTQFQKAVDLDIALTVLFDPAHHGNLQPDDWTKGALGETLAQCDLRGIDPATRGILAMCGQRVAVAFDSSKTILQLVQEAAEMVKIRDNPIPIFSVGCISTVSSLLATNRVRINTNDTPRAPVLANAFYPADEADRRTLIGELAEACSVEPAPDTLAILTPHAGLSYSGRIAMDAWRSAPFAETVIVIGPKHTQLGADWAVSPSAAWQLPGGYEVACDLELARNIAAHVEGMELDATAHAQEHCAEVQLPFVERWASDAGQQPKMVFIAMSQASWPEIKKAASQLADVIRPLQPRPLLVVSNDMNHFASNDENRRRDALALQALEGGDPEALLEVCRLHAISMCGVVPAALVMQTLIELEEPCTVEQISYDTSGSFSGDLQRVVGYAACRWRRSS